MQIWWGDLLVCGEVMKYQVVNPNHFLSTVQGLEAGMFARPQFYCLLQQLAGHHPYVATYTSDKLY